MGTVLYQGGFDPEFHNGVQPPYQNFTVEIPDDISGLAVLGVAHFSLVGVNSITFLSIYDRVLTSCAFYTGQYHSFNRIPQPDSYCCIILFTTPCLDKVRLMTPIFSISQTAV